MPGEPGLLFSACLLGRPCRWDGRDSRRQWIIEIWESRGGVVVCPEEMGGLPTPRPASTLAGGDGRLVLEGAARVMTTDGSDVTEAFVRGARLTLERAREGRVGRAYLKSASPSCGCVTTNVDSERVQGRGVTAALLEREGVEIIEVD